ncbi:tubulin folding cofactor D TBCD [Gracilaria domingensis]|nr:tubulin folding cofactor D TBCD [Gracilaria domingensis]
MAQSCRPSLLEHRQQLDDALDALRDPAAPPSTLQSYCDTLDHYLQLPALLDPVVPTHVATLCDILEKRLSTFLPPPPAPPEAALTAPSRALYTLLKVRGGKNVTASFPHEVRHLRELVPLYNLTETHITWTNFWQLRYVLLTWLSVCIRVPFPLHSVLAPNCLQQAVDHACAALSNTGPIATAAASFLARLIARSDTSDKRARLISWAVSHTLRPSVPSQLRAAGLSFLAVTFKYAPRELVRPFLPQVLNAVDTIVTDDISGSTIEAHLIAKLSQRLALTFLPPQPLSWRYIRRTRNLFSAPGHTGKLEPSPTPSLNMSEAEALEVVIDMLLSALCHRDTVVRWSAAKGLARITSRLPTSLAFDVVESVMQLFDERSEARADAALHGACLALAELVRRGLILPENALFAKAFDAVRVAASFDMRRGANSVGSYVRDAACYAVWAIARAYESEHVAPFADVISESMIPVALLDREVNCRRAAAAALQECVGRLSEQLFQDGIQIITLADYFSLGDRNVSYMEIALKVATLANQKHFSCILRELWQRKLVHWDSAIRSLAAKSLSGLVAVDTEGVIVQQVIPHLVEVATQR